VPVKGWMACSAPVPRKYGVSHKNDPYSGAGNETCPAATCIFTAFVRQHRPLEQFASVPTAYRGSKWKSERCNTLTLSPLALGTLALLGFGFGNNPVVLSTGYAGGWEQNVLLHELQMYLPSRPLTSAYARTCVHTAPSVVALKSLMQVALLWNWYF